MTSKDMMILGISGAAVVGIILYMRSRPASSASTGTSTATQPSSGSGNSVAPSTGTSTGTTNPYSGNGSGSSLSSGSNPSSGYNPTPSQGYNPYPSSGNTSTSSSSNPQTSGPNPPYSYFDPNYQNAPGYNYNPNSIYTPLSAQKVYSANGVTYTQNANGTYTITAGTGMGSVLNFAQVMANMQLPTSQSSSGGSSYAGGSSSIPPVYPQGNYPSIQAYLNGRSFAAIEGPNYTTFLLYTALDIAGVQYTFKGNGLFQLSNGNYIRGIPQNGTTYIPWDSVPGIRDSFSGGHPYFTVS